MVRFWGGEKLWEAQVSHPYEWVWESDTEPWELSLLCIDAATVQWTSPPHALLLHSCGMMLQWLCSTFNWPKAFHLVLWGKRLVLKLALSISEKFPSFRLWCYTNWCQSEQIPLFEASRPARLLNGTFLTLITFVRSEVIRGGWQITASCCIVNSPNSQRIYSTSSVAWGVVVWGECLTWVEVIFGVLES